MAFAASTAPFKLTATNISDFLFIPISLLFASLFSILTNNMADYEIDRISHPDRPLVSGSIRFYVYQRLAWPFLGAALFYAIIVNFTTLFFVTLLIGNYFLYSMPPFRLKRVTFFSKLVISVNSLAAVMLGVLTITDSLYNLPAITFPIVLIGITAVANFLDIKDYEGDKQVGIATLPVVLGLTKAKILVGLFFILTYGALFLVIDFLKAPLYWLPVFVFLGIIQFFLTNRKRYNENLVLGVILLTIWLVIYLISRYASAVI